MLKKVSLIIFFGLFPLPSLAYLAFDNPYDSDAYDTGDGACASLGAVFGQTGFTMGTCNGIACGCLDANGNPYSVVYKVCTTDTGSMIGYNVNHPDCSERPVTTSTTRSSAANSSPFDLSSVAVDFLQNLAFGVVLIGSLMTLIILRKSIKTVNRV